MTSYPTPTWGDIDTFCIADQWDGDRETDHSFWEKTLPSGEVLQTHRSRKATEEIGPDLFRVILRTQLKVNRAEFWEAIRTGEPVERPIEPLEEAPTHDAWVVRGLLKHGYSEAEVHAMSPDEARELLLNLWSTPS